MEPVQYISIHINIIFGIISCINSVTGSSYHSFGHGSSLSAGLLGNYAGGLSGGQILEHLSKIKEDNVHEIHNGKSDNSDNFFHHQYNSEQQVNDGAKSFIDKSFATKTISTHPKYMYSNGKNYGFGGPSGDIHSFHNLKEPNHNFNDNNGKHYQTYTKAEELEDFKNFKGLESHGNSDGFSYYDFNADYGKNSGDLKEHKTADSGEKYDGESFGKYDFGKEYSDSEQHDFGKGGSESEKYDFGKGGSESEKYDFGKGSSDSEKYDFGKGSSDSEKYDFGKGNSDSEKYDFGKGSSDSEKYDFGKGSSDSEKYDFGKGSSESEKYDFGKGSSDSEKYNFGKGNSDSEKYDFGKESSEKYDFGKESLEKYDFGKDGSDEENFKKFEESAAGKDIFSQHNGALSPGYDTKSFETHHFKDFDEKDHQDGQDMMYKFKHEDEHKNLINNDEYKVYKGYGADHINLLKNAETALNEAKHEHGSIFGSDDDHLTQNYDHRATLLESFGGEGNYDHPSSDAEVEIHHNEQSYGNKGKFISKYEMHIKHDTGMQHQGVIRHL